MSCRLGDPDALLWSTTSQSGEAIVPTVLAHSGAESDKCSVVECMDWQSAGTMLATGSMDGWVRIWNKSGTVSPAAISAQCASAPEELRHISTALLFVVWAACYYLGCEGQKGPVCREVWSHASVFNEILCTIGHAFCSCSM